MTQTRKGDPSNRICLIVEDSEVDQIKMTRIVRRSPYGLVPVIVSTLEAARRTLRDRTPVLFLLDNNLPDGLGANFVKQLADDDKYRNIPRIIVTDWPSPFMWEKAASAGVSYVLSKSDFDGRHIQAALMGKFDPHLKPQIYTQAHRA